MNKITVVPKWIREFCSAFEELNRKKMFKRQFWSYFFHFLRQDEDVENR